MQNKRSNSPVVRLTVGVVMGALVTIVSIIGFVVMVPVSLLRIMAANLRRLLDGDTTGPQ